MFGQWEEKGKEWKRKKKCRREKEGTRKGKENMCLDANKKINLRN